MLPGSGVSGARFLDGGESREPPRWVVLGVFLAESCHQVLVSLKRLWVVRRWIGSVCIHVIVKRCSYVMEGRQLTVTLPKLSATPEQVLRPSFLVIAFISVQRLEECKIHLVEFISLIRVDGCSLLCGLDLLEGGGWCSITWLTGLLAINFTERVHSWRSWEIFQRHVGNFLFEGIFRFRSLSLGGFGLGLHL